MKKIMIAIIAGLLIAMGLLLIGPQLEKPKAVISITFDDGYSNQYRAAAELENYSYKGTFYIPANLIGKEFENISIMTEEQILALHNKSNEIGGHTANHVNTSNLTAEEYEKEVVDGKNVSGIITENFAYPCGDDSKKEIALKYYKTTRSTRACINKFSDRELCGLTLVHTNGEYKALAGYLNNLKQNGGWLVIVIHNINKNPRPDVDLTQEEFDWILKQVNSTGIPVKTIAEVLAETNSAQELI